MRLGSQSEVMIIDVVGQLKKNYSQYRVLCIIEPLTLMFL